LQAQVSLVLLLWLVIQVLQRLLQQQRSIGHSFVFVLVLPRQLPVVRQLWVQKQGVCQRLITVMTGRVVLEVALLQQRDLQGSRHRLHPSLSCSRRKSRRKRSSSSSSSSMFICQIRCCSSTLLLR
jgi:hypothetical protein